MTTSFPIGRRQWLWMASASASVSASAASVTVAADATFPAQPWPLVKEMVGVSHGNPKRVRELLEQRPALVNAGWDWGFGDWETALGAASHVGNKEIAELLLAAGAAPTLFSATMLGQTEVVKAMVAARPGVHGAIGPHGITLLAHAKNGGSKEMVAYLESLGNASGSAPLTLTPQDKDRLQGIYSFGPGDNERIEITAPKGQLTFNRLGGGTPRPIYYLGDGEFYPAGARAVRIRVDGKSLSVHDGELVVTAKAIAR